MGKRIVFILAICLIAAGRNVVSTSESNPSNYTRHPLKYESIYSFGDSLTDTGNFLLAGPTAYPAVKNLPYGMTSFKKAAGRLCDGRLVIDFIAQASGLAFVPPYRAVVAEGLKAEQGVNFAVAGATALDAKYFHDKGIGPLLWTNDSLNVQLGWFRQIKSKLCTNKQDCEKRFSKSLFLVGEIGANDYNLPFFVGQTIEELKPSVAMVVEEIVRVISVLIEEGATELVVPGNFPIGWSAAFLTLFQTPNKEAYDKHGCLQAYNVFAKYHNAQLNLGLERLRQKYPQSRIIYVDYYSASKRMIAVPRHHGFTNGVLKACCGGGGPYNFDISVMCGQPGSKACEDPTTYANWDGMHLTEAAYRYFALGLINGTYTSRPLKYSLGLQLGWIEGLIRASEMK